MRTSSAETLTITASSVDEIAAALKQVWTAHTPTIVVDRGELGPADGERLARVSMRRLRHIVRIDRDNLAIVVEAGVTIGAMRDALGETGLWCPALRWLPDDETIGCAVAADHGRRSRHYGTVADYLLGTRFVCPSTGLVRHGGLAIKNATGYNLSRCVAGSRGLFAVIVEIILRLVPRSRGRVVRRYLTSSATLAWRGGERLSRAWNTSENETGTVQPLAAIELWLPLNRDAAALQVELEAGSTGGVTMAAVDATLAGSDVTREVEATGPWPPFDPTSDRSIVRTASRLSDLKQVVDGIRLTPGDSTSPASVLTELTGGAIEIWSDAADRVADRLALSASHGNRDASRQRLFRLLKTAFDPDDLLRANPHSTQTDRHLDADRA